MLLMSNVEHSFNKTVFIMLTLKRGGQKEIAECLPIYEFIFCLNSTKLNLMHIETLSKYSVL